MISIADRSRAIRNTFGLNTQQDLADVLGCSLGKIKAYEQGTTKRFKPADIMILKEKYNLNQEWLEFGTGEMILTSSQKLLKDIEDMSFALNENISSYVKEIVPLLPYASQAYLEQVIQKLKEFKKLSE